MHASSYWLLAVAVLSTSCSRSVELSSSSAAGGSGTSGSTAATPTGSTTNGATTNGTTHAATTNGVTSTTTSSTGGTAGYSAYDLVTNLPRYVVFKVEPAADRCIQLMVSASGGPGIGIQTPTGWTVDQALVSAHASDCALDASGYPIVPMMSSPAQMGSGTLTHQPTGFQPCTVSVHATLTFAPGLAGVPTTDALDVDNLAIQGPVPCGG
jgi:hypothetical protein